jgi:hypothetical protein
MSVYSQYSEHTGKNKMIACSIISGFAAKTKMEFPLLNDAALNTHPGNGTANRYPGCSIHEEKYIQP